MASMTYEQALARLPKGWSLWGNHGDGKWRAGCASQENLIVPADTMEEAVNRALTLAAGGSAPLSIDPATRDYQLAAQQATEEGHRPGSHEWWAALRQIKAGWLGLSPSLPVAAV